MKLLMISGDRKILPGEGGAFLTTLEGLQKRCERIDVICPRSAHTPGFPHQEGAYRVFDRVWFHPSPWPLVLHPLWIRLRGAKLLLKHHHDVITAQEYVPRILGRPAVALARRFHVPSCGEIHGDPLSRLASRPAVRRAYGARFGRKIAAHTAIRVVNNSLKHEMMSFGVPKNLLNVVPAIYLDLSVFRPRPDISKRYSACFCGRLVPGKGIEMLLDAIARVPSATLLVIGDGPERDAAELQCDRLGLTGRVTFAGWQRSQEDLAVLLASAEVFVMSSQAEGGPRVAFEAMAMGLPVISTRVGLLNEVMTDGDEGRFFDGTTEALVPLLTELLANPDQRKKYGEKGVILAAGFERGKAVDAYADFLASL